MLAAEPAEPYRIIDPHVHVWKNDPAFPWAKETAMLIAFVAGFEALRKRGPWSAAIACGIAFAIPTLLLRTIYPAPISQWAWWDTFKMNVPFIVWDPVVISKSLRDNLKVLLFFNVMLLWAWRAWRLKTIREIADLVLVIFPFEEKIYRDAGVPVTFVGHPLIDLAASADKDSYSPSSGSDFALLLVPSERSSSRISRKSPSASSAGAAAA